MKISIISICLLLTSIAGLRAQPSASGQAGVLIPTPYQLVEQGANYNIWGRQEYEKAPNGTIVSHLHQYTQVASGLNFLVNGKYQASKEEIDILPDGTAAATNGQHQIFFPSDIYEGEIVLKIQNDLATKSQPICLEYDDGSHTALIAVLTNSIGQLVSSNQVVYPNAFMGLNADLRFTYRLSGIEQDVILKSQPPTPESLGLDPEKAKLQVLTEFIDSPEPRITEKRTATGELADENLDFGTMRMIPGRAFLTDQADDPGHELRVGKQWLNIGGRHILVEQVPVNDLTAALVQLPMASAKAGSPSLSHVVSAQRLLPKPRLIGQAKAHSFQIAKADLPVKGLVLDYNAINSTLTNYTFQSDTTYFVSSALYLYGKILIEGSSVIKFSNGGAIYAGAGCQLNWQGNMYQPVVFTAKDDDAVGQPISGSTGNPSGYYAQYALNLNGISMAFEGFRISYAKQGIMTANGENSFYDGQLFNCQNGIEPESANVNLRNMWSAPVEIWTT